MLLNTVTFLLGVELILFYSGLADCAITNFQCTDGPVCAEDRIECNCTTDSGTLQWDISYSLVEPLIWKKITTEPVTFSHGNDDEKYSFGYNFTFNTTYTGPDTSILTFNLNQSESVLINCTDSNYGGTENTTVTDLGYYAKAPTNLTTTFNASGVTLQWEDTGNICTKNSTEYQVTVISCSCASTSVLMYNTSNTALHINSRDLLENVPYTYTVRGWNEQLSNNSEPFTLAPVEVMSVTINITNTTDPCKNNSCCVNVTLNIILASSHPNQYYNISLYNSNTVLSLHEIKETERTGSELKYNEAHCFTVKPMNNFSTEMPINNDTTTECQCQSPGSNSTTPDFNVSITAINTTDNCNYDCCANITISIQLVSNTSSDPQYANQQYIISYNDSITGIEESVVTNKGEQSKNIQLPYEETYCFTITPVYYFDSGLEKSQCIMILKCNTMESGKTSDGATLGIGLWIAVGIDFSLRIIIITIIIIITTCISLILRKIKKNKVHGEQSSTSKE